MTGSNVDYRIASSRVHLGREQTRDRIRVNSIERHRNSSPNRSVATVPQHQEGVDWWTGIWTQDGGLDGGSPRRLLGVPSLGDVSVVRSHLGVQVRGNKIDRGSPSQSGWTSNGHRPLIGHQSDVTLARE